MMHGILLAQAEPFLLFFLGVVVLIAIAAVAAAVSRKKERDRTAAIARVAAQAGFQFTPQGDMPFQRLFEFHFFRQGRRRAFTNVLSDRHPELGTYLFDYKWVISSGKNSRTYRRTVAAFCIDSAAFPVFEMRPEHFGHKLISAFGYQDIDFSMMPEFSSRYLLRGPNEAAIRSLFDSAAALFFTRDANWLVEGGGRWLIMTLNRNRLAPNELMDFLAQASEGFEILFGNLVSRSAGRG